VSGWRDRALCAEVGGDFWFPEAGAPAHIAKAICNRCPVKQECLFDALFEENELWHGIRGGATPKERREMLRQRRDTA